uniref:Tail assembly chaperone n=1 Tax=Siphoviridae sp. cthae16 TaxID=2825617 RepID=A0A8S5URJ8_9CAUD|nr:MAG TPA: tail assembly chaperone [Siphoviridae sp. cthae16]
MKEIKIETDVAEYRLNDKCSVFFNPADPVFVGRVYDALEKLKVSEDTKNKDLATLKGKGREVFAYLKKLDQETRATLDELLGEDTCKQLFGSVSVYAYAGGLPLWLNLILAIIDELDEGVKRQHALQDEQIAKYINKYKR